MVEVKRIKSPSDIPAEGSYVLVLYGPSAMDREHPRGRTLMVRDGTRDKVKLGDAHLADKLAYLRWYNWSATTAPRLPAPIRSEAGAVPFYDGLRLHNRQCV